MKYCRQYNLARYLIVYAYLQTFFLAIFRLSPMTHMRKVGSGFGKKSCVSTGVRKSGTHRCITDCHDMTLTVHMTLDLTLIETNDRIRLTSIHLTQYTCNSFIRLVLKKVKTFIKCQLYKSM